MSRQADVGTVRDRRMGSPAVRSLLVLALAVVWSAGLLPRPASAHTLDTQGFSEIAQQGDDVRYELIVDYAAFATVAGLRQPGAGPTDHAARALRQGEQAAADYLDEHLQVLVDGVACAAELTGSGIEQRFEQPYARFSLRYDCPGAGEYEIRYSVLVADLDPGHVNVAGYDLGGTSGEFVFHAKNRDLVVGEGNLLRQAYRFVVLGFHHILAGLDHLLFVVALLIGARNLREVLRVVTVFTLAHSVTLILTAVDVVHLPSSVVEPLIALSIAYVAATNAVGRAAPRARLAVVFGFGLLHGMGFAGGLQLTGEVDWSSISSLLSFNVGIELGQALIVGLLFPVVLLARRHPWSKYVQLAATGVITVFGLVWFVERVLA
ncbi:HupE/UreJ family protein [Actinopolymorpha pittospori]|uniref:Hydrogenase/urease accessory protein HupE n=1 Tax=Actinopolymorpha pittospori TaxID=648752 RepID=A0A927RD87_9ACTN|nr:HupE/UreJ family protein [Actinopolymorpha pittospori]MBE1612107.1 hydrogenase/urease accessory protein HupE [Actinopolymorpha pittospori]